MKTENRGKIEGTQLLFTIWQLNGLEAIHVTEENPKFVYTPTFQSNLEKLCQVPQWNHCASTLHRPATAGTAERAVRGFKEGTSSILLQSGFGERWWAESMDCYGHSRNVQDLFSMGELHMDGDSRNNSVGQSYHSERKSNIIRYQQQIRRGSIRSARKHSQASLWVTLHMRGEAGKETY